MDKASIEIDYISITIHTKPNALNIGLQNPKGDMLIIWESVDRSEPSEIRKMAKYMLTHLGMHFN